MLRPDIFMHIIAEALEGGKIGWEYKYQRKFHTGRKVDIHTDT